jgi:tetratricopeptide (TPR) repeat protein
MRMRILILAPLIMLFLMIQATLAEETDFDQGLRHYHAGKWEEAKRAFEKALIEHPDDAATYFNLGLAQFQLGQRGYAVAYWRKALAIAPGREAPAKALENVDEKFHFSHLEKSPWSLAIHNLFVRFGWDVWLGLLTFATGLCGYLWLGYLKQKKLSFISEAANSPHLHWVTLFLTLLFVIIVAANVAKWLDDQKDRAVVVAAAAELKSAPSVDGVTLAPLPEASEVAIIQTHEDWAQVVTGESASGWVKKSDIVPTAKGMKW